ncbi:hypothetical protein [Deinococcus sp. UR1]|uniref:hypothetical protein n=1 Tax=Deinococcus sp. UR1 TaxID=1704277 RepID=UPI000C18517C|nr:hypothetical protein [Deinococcus sp. UR1]PIG96857.1 hypothetical protein AMD26_015105 [Deinococcus sp. UR1]
MTTYRVEIGIGLLGPMEGMLAESVADFRALFPNQAHAVKHLARAAHIRWLEYASGKRALPNGKQLQAVSGTYLSSIRIEEDGELRYVIYSDDPKAEWIEEGFPSFDMKKMLRTSDRARIGKDGTRYMYIPFRHKTSGATAGLGLVMPQAAESWWVSPNRQSSAVTGHYREGSVNGGGAVTRNTYTWGDRLTRAELEGIGIDPDSKIGQRMEGMVRFQNNEDRGGQHVTFRVMSEKSSGWLMPKRDGAFPAKAAFEWVQQHYERVMKTALEEDVKNMGGRIS